MKNCKHFQGDSIEFYKTLRARKRDAQLVARLERVDVEMTECFTWYDGNFATNTLELAVPRACSKQEVDDLKELYDYDSYVLRELKVDLTTTPTGRIVKCQNCTINDVNTFDHLLPQSEFPEFIVNPKNLICSCGDCNGRKGNIWRENGTRTSLNLYLDILPDVQYLYVNNEVGNFVIETTFFLSQPQGMDDDLFAKIESHYKRLDLLRRFSEGAYSVISSLKTVIEPLRDYHDLPEVQMIVKQSIEKERIAFGYNYWQSILKLELVTNDDFMIDFE